MNPASLVRDASKVHADLYETKNTLLTTKGCKIYSPRRFAERKLAVIANEIRIVGIYAISVQDRYYGVSLANAMMQIKPSSTSIVEVDGDEYYEFSFEPGSVVIPNLELVKDKTLTYHIYDEIIAKGNVPWFMSYEDLGKLFVSAKYHAGITLAANNVPLEMIAASISRTQKDRSKYFRHEIKNIDDQFKLAPFYVAFRSVIHGATNTTSKLMGAYFGDGMMSALVNPSEKVEDIETLLRL